MTTVHFHLWHSLLGVATLLLIAGRVSCQANKPATIPSYIRICKQSDSNVENCMIDSIERLRPYLVKGIPEFKVPSIEPLNIKSINANQGSGFRITLNDVKAYGCSDFSINRLKLDMKTNSIDFGLNLPNLYIESNYEVDGRIFLLPIKGRGPLRGNFTNCKGDVALRGALEKKGEKDYLKYKSMDIKIQVGKGRLNLENLFGGDKTLGTVVNEAINANFEQIMRELKPQIEKAISNFMLDTANQIVQSYPHSELFPK